MDTVYSAINQLTLQQANLTFILAIAKTMPKQPAFTTTLTNPQVCKGGSSILVNTVNGWGSWWPGG